MQEDTTAIKAKGVVKSVQRGVLKSTEAYRSKDVVFNIPISSVDVNKACLSCYVGASYDDYDVRMADASLNSTQIAVTVAVVQSELAKPYITWQVVEFY